MRFHLRPLYLLLAGLVLAPEAAAAQAGGHTVMAVFAHPDDERIVGPLLARLAREHDRVVWVVSTDGSKGVTPFAGIPAGPKLAAVRAGESRCAAEKLGIQPPILLGLEDAGLSSFEALGRLRTELTRLVQQYRPAVVLTIGPEGGTGHPDHRLVGNVITEVVGGLDWPDPPTLYYASLPAERMRDAPPARPHVTPVLERYLSVRVPFTSQDLAAARASYDCHASQYTAAQRDSVDAMLAHGFAGSIWLRPAFASATPATELFR
jgi:LmbE family N-acetylglucosaminyl deacetylase